MENLGYEPLRLPVQDSSLRTRLVESGNLKTFFKIWDGVLQANLGVTDSSESKSVVFTVSDAMFTHLVTADQTYHIHHGIVVDPFQLEPVLQRLVIMTQLVAGGLHQSLNDEEWSEQELKTVGKRSITLRRKEGKLFANEIPIVDVHASDNSVIFVMEKILWMRPEDIECGIVRLVEK